MPASDPAAGVHGHVAPRQLAPVAAVSAATTIWLAALGLVSTPYMLNRLGVSAYAVFALVTIVSAYLGNLELGFGHATVRFLTRARADGDVTTEERVIGTSMFVFSAAAVIGSIAAVVGAPFVVKSFADFPAGIEDEAVDAVRIAAVLIVLTFLFSFGSVCLQALGQFRTLLVTRLIGGTLLTGSAVAAAAIFDDVRAVLLAQVGTSVLACALVYSALAKATAARLRPVFHRATFRTMRGYGALVLATGLAYQAMMQGPPTVLAGVARAAELTAFAVPAIVLQQIVLLTTAASTGFFPFASAESASDDVSRLRSVFRSHVRITMLVMAPITGFLVTFAYPLLAAWVDDEFAREAADPLRLLAGAGLLLALGGPASDVARGLGRMRWIVAYSGSAAVLAVTAALILADEAGADGAAMAMLIGMSTTTAPFVVLAARRLLGMPAFALVRALAVPATASLTACAGFVAGAAVSDGLVAALAVGFVVTAVYALAVFAFVLEEREKATLAGGAAPILRMARGGRSAV